ncbi:hypothetical protein COV39_01035 [Candidatus Berkelbacteria bacterium CG11_big_fil_rev_8_21_14_0_20_40_23]|nr:MAG: hypothetical protein COV39_01035 [Candidatus Berkelbacteria bacterium CG11_big_fil_rev_8_21_14_0_20_40_23]
MFTKEKRLKVQMTIMLAIVGIGIGWLFAVQFKTTPSRVLNPVTPYLSLTQAQATLTRDQDETKNKIKALKKEIDESQAQIKIQQKSAKTMVEELEQLKDKVGLTEKKGKGVVVTLADSSKEIPNIDSIVHAADLRDLVNVLWGADAQAISVNDERLTNTSSIDSIINTILVDNTKITNPFVIRVEGDQKKIQKVLEDANALSDIKKRVKSEGLVFNTEKSDVTVNEFGASFSVNFAKTK